MPGYKFIEQALETVLDIQSDYYKDGGNQNISRGDYRILGKGLKRAIILNPGPIRDHGTAQFPRRMRTLWIINIELYILFQDDVSAIADAIRDDRQTIIDHLDKYPTLNGTVGVVVARLEGAAEPQVMLGENHQWWRQVLPMAVEERVTVTIAES